MIRFEIPGEVVAQGRPRATRIGKGVRMYDPPKSSAYKQHVAEVAKEHAPKKPLEAPLMVRMVIYRQFLQSWTKKQRKDAEDGILLPVTRPDLSNYCKGIEDALNGIIWKDDSQIVSLTLEKHYAERSYAFIEIQTL
ncbi:RusA family crossover junction endodeoxyribonuclease [Sporosarcina sp. Sa2YVA2]|uniref:RusA family crossover junction endodeoxyribonuclease n=1 Tax=Sporosarcina quadrami TaxID=2762234 RepID=A0ABR8U8S6_9BACL|nr:RusA family crossover junction endodeoxyribonuclease [Sporosarcina quadrami]